MPSMRIFGVAFVVVAGGCGEEVDPCAESGTACVWAGTGELGFNNLTPNAHRLNSKFYFPEDVTFAPDGRAYIADWNNHMIRRVEHDDTVTVVIGTDYEGDGDPEMQDRLPLCAPAGAAGTDVAMNHPTDIEFGPDGVMYVAAWHNNKIRMFDPATGIVTAYGNSYGYTDNGPACTAIFNQPKSIAIAPDNTLYTIDQRNVRIRAIEPAGERMITTIAGKGIVGNQGDGGLAMDAEFGFETGTTPRPTGALVLNGRDLLVADSANNRIRRINLDTNIIDCIAGKLTPGYTGDGGQAIDATLNFPMDMELGPDGRLYIADRYNHVIRAMDLTTGVIETVAGTGTKCDLDEEECADGRPALEMPLHEPYGVAFDAPGNMYIADSHNHRFLKVTR
ncbi:MAG: hypothetical protein WKG01_08160 [Kofleriaceae bacterium]